MTGKGITADGAAGGKAKGIKRGKPRLMRGGCGVPILTPDDMETRGYGPEASIGVARDAETGRMATSMDGDMMSVPVSVTVRCPEIAELLRDGSAIVAVEVVCPSTNYRETTPYPRGGDATYGFGDDGLCTIELTHVVDVRNLLDQYVFEVTIVAVDDITGYRPESLLPDYAANKAGYTYGKYTTMAVACRINGNMTPGGRYMGYIEEGTDADAPIDYRCDPGNFSIILKPDVYRTYVEHENDSRLRGTVTGWIFNSAIPGIIGEAAAAEAKGDKFLWSDDFRNVLRNACKDPDLDLSRVTEPGYKWNTTNLASRLTSECVSIPDCIRDVMALAGETDTTR